MAAAREQLRRDALVIAAVLGVSMTACLVILMFAPVVAIVVYEAQGYQHQATALAD